jgi:hypothetical protein
LTVAELRAKARAMRAWSTLSCLLALSACKMPEAPGELIGTYAITGTLLENTCGSAALPVDEILQYRAELREDDRSAYWIVGQPPAHQGRRLRTGELEFTQEQKYAVRQDRTEPVDPELAEMDPLALYGYDPFGEPGEPGEPASPEADDCTLIIEESVRVRLVEGDSALRDAGMDPDQHGGLIGENEIGMRASAGFECSQVLEPAGGPFEQLPCSARYAIEGERLED